MTPLLHLKRLGKEIGLENLYLKDEGIIPTGTFKARGAAVGVSRAKELGVKVLAMPTNGNAGPTESLIIADQTADPMIVAVDMRFVFICLIAGLLSKELRLGSVYRTLPLC